MDLEEAIIHGMATVLWGLAWADHVEEQGCCSLAGQKIDALMPPIEEAAVRKVERWAGRIEQANGMGLVLILCDAAQADGLVAEPFDSWDRVSPDYAERFGECLAYMAMGHGVSWFDDHARFPLKVPDCGDAGGDSIDMQELSASVCPYCGDDAEGIARWHDGCYLAVDPQTGECERHGMPHEES